MMDSKVKDPCTSNGRHILTGITFSYTVQSATALVVVLCNDRNSRSFSTTKYGTDGSAERVMMLQRNSPFRFVNGIMESWNGNLFLVSSHRLIRRRRSRRLKTNICVYMCIVCVFIPV